MEAVPTAPQFIQSLRRHVGASGPSDTMKALILGFATVTGCASAVDGRSVLGQAETAAPTHEIRLQRLRSHLPTERMHAAQASEGAPTIDAHGIQEFLGIKDEPFARHFFETVQPLLLPGGSYHLRMVDHHEPVNAAYFGMRHAHGQFMRTGRLVARTTYAVGRPEYTTELYTAGLEDFNGNPSDVQGLMSTLVHELIHTRGRETQDFSYFLQRVQSNDRIPFPYTEAYLAGNRDRSAVLWDGMADEYRSELIACFFRVRLMQPGESFEDVVVEALRDRFQNISVEGVRADIRAVQSWNPAINWPELLKRYHGMSREFANQYQSVLLTKRYITPLHDEGLQAVLQHTMQSTAQTDLERLFTLGSEGPGERRALLIALRDYQLIKIQEFDQRIQKVSHKGHQLFQQWQGILDAFQYTHIHQAKQTVRGVRENAEESDQDSFSIGIQIAPQEFSRNWNRLPEAERDQLRPLFEESARYVLGNFPLPAEYATRLQALPAYTPRSE